MTFRKICFQMHWCIGIIAGIFLALMGLSGASLSFQEEIIDVLNPGAIRMALGNDPSLPPVQLLQAIRANGELRRIERLELHAYPGRNPSITFAVQPGQAHSERAWVNAATGQVQTGLLGAHFFDWMERLHIWLLLPTEIGQPVTGIMSACLFALCLSGLYLRWPRKPWSLKTWLHLNLRHRGRPLVWSLHSVLGTWVLLIFLLLSATGMYWGLTPLRAWVDGWAGIAPRTAATSGENPQKLSADIVPETLTPAWSRFEQLAPAWQFVQIRIPRTPGQDYQFNWHTADAPHAMARNRLRLSSTGAIKLDERHAHLSSARRALTTIYPLHVGSYFGLPGRIAMMLASLLVPLFSITGWMLYLDRRSKARRSLDLPPQPYQPTAALEPDTKKHSLAVIYASQSGYARHLAQQTAQHIRQAGHHVELLSATKATPQLLKHHALTLWLVSTFGEGDAPDDGRGLLPMLRSLKPSLPPASRHGVLALGDSRYPHFCSFGLQLHEALRQAGSSALFDPVLQDAENPQGWLSWCSELSTHALMSRPAPRQAVDARAFSAYQLLSRVHCTPHSSGAPLYRLELQAIDGTAPHWQAGALVEVLAEATNTLPADHQVGTVAPPSTPRRYSVASLPEDGGIQLWVRQVQHGGRLGLASGWLTQGLPLHGIVQLRLLANPHFAPKQPSEPSESLAIFIGNGSGYAGLRAQLLSRIRQQQHQNWFLFGERHPQADRWAETEISKWQASGLLRHADYAYSRDAQKPCYVQHLLEQHSERLRNWVAQDAVIYICGSYQGMANDVEQTLRQLLGNDAFQQLLSSGRYRRDVY